MPDLPLCAQLAGRTLLALCVDDNPAILKLLERILHRAGIRTLNTACGCEAVRLALQYYPDIMLLDVTLPDIDGYEVMKALARLSPVAPPPAVLVTGRLGNDDERRWQFAGAAGFIAKPFTDEQVLEAVERAARKALVSL